MTEFTGHSLTGRCIIEQARKDRLWILTRDGLLVIAALTKIDEVVLTNAAKRKSAGSASGGQTSTADQGWIDGRRLPTPRKAAECDHAEGKGKNRRHQISIAGKAMEPSSHSRGMN
jgi:hypothetical protein